MGDLVRQPSGRCGCRSDAGVRGGGGGGGCRIARVRRSQKTRRMLLLLLLMLLLAVDVHGRGVSFRLNAVGAGVAVAESYAAGVCRRSWLGG